jgi:hypothetical protein
MNHPQPIQAHGVFDGILWRPVFKWAVLDIVLTMLALIPIMLYIAGPAALSEDDAIANPALDQALASTGFMMLSFVVGLAVTIFASYWAARSAGSLHVRHGGWTAVVSAVLGTAFLLLPADPSSTPSPLWYNALSLALMLPAGLFGGWIAMLREQHVV